MTQAIIANQLRSLFDRWRNLEEQKANVSEDLKELFAEARGAGYQPKELRIAFREQVRSEDSEAVAKDDESRAVVDLYLSALAGARTREAA